MVISRRESKSVRQTSNIKSAQLLMKPRSLNSLGRLLDGSRAMEGVYLRRDALSTLPTQRSISD